MIRLRPSRLEELEIFCDMQAQPHAARFVHATDLASHREHFVRDDFVYLTIEDNDGLAGYIVIVLEADGRGVEFRRILVDHDRRGIGQDAICEMEKYCRSLPGIDRIWLDVYDDNDVGIHVYEKLGYRRFASEVCGDRLLHFYAKRLR